MTTIETLTTEQIETLATESAAAGDTEMWAICERALNDDTAAQRKVVKAIRSAEAQD